MLEEEELGAATSAGKQRLQRTVKREDDGIEGQTSNSRRAAPGHKPQWPTKCKRLTRPFLCETINGMPLTGSGVGAMSATSSACRLATVLADVSPGTTWPKK